MNTPWELFESWPVRVVVLGGVILLVGRILVACIRQPARRALVGTATVLSALAIVPLTLLPGWLPVEISKPIPAVAKADEKAEAPLLPEAATQTVEPKTLPRAALPQYVFVPVPSAPAEAPVANPAAAVVEPMPIAKISEPAPSAEQPSRWPAWLVGIYAAIASLLLVRLVIGHFGLARLWRTGRMAPTWAERVFRELAATTCPRAEMRVSERVGGPVCFGVTRPRVLVPLSLIAAGDGDALRAIFAHELGHLQRKDPLAGWLLGLARALYFVWPWLSGLRREVRLAQEFLSDLDAARRSSGPADYAELLIRLTRARPAPLGAAGVRGSSSDLYRRVTMLLRNSRPIEGRCPRRWALAIGSGLTALAIAIAGVYVQPRAVTAAEPEKKEPEKKTEEKKPAEKKEAPKPAAKADSLKLLIEKLKKDVGDDPEAAKQLDALLRTLRASQAPAVAPGIPAVPGVPPVPVPLPLLPQVGIAQPDFDKDLQKIQQEMRQQMEAMMRQLRAGGFRAAVMVPAPGMVPGMPGGGRLGIRVDRPSDTLASQLDLPNGQGLVCADVPAQSTAGKIGLKPHDVLLEVAGKPVSNNAMEFVQALTSVKPDQAVDIVVVRKGKKETLKGVKLPEAKDVPFSTLTPSPFQPVRPLPVRPPGAGIGVVAGPGETVRVEKVNDAFTVFYSKNGVKVTITGSKEAGAAAKADSIEIDDNGKTTKAESIDKLPKEYQDLARSAMKSIK